MRFEQLEYPLAPNLAITFIDNVVTVYTALNNNTDLTLCLTTYSRLYNPQRKQRLLRYRTLASWCLNGDCVLL